MSPLISVIIPTFNRAAMLAEAIDSVRAQSERDFELLVIDDGSTDETQRVCASYGAQLCYFKQDHRGVSAARNFGIAQARGAFITFLDSDDLWQKHKLRRQRAWLAAQPQIMLCYTNEIWIRRGVRVNQKKIHQKAGGWIYPLCLPRCIISPSSVLMRRELFEHVGGFDETLPICEDYDLWLRVAARFEIGFLDEPLILKRGGHADQLSHSEYGVDRYRVLALQKMLHGDALNEEWRAQTEAMLHEKRRILALGYGKRGKREEAEAFLELKSN
ncbi:MAG: glycosyltransferase [candidate division KSB1 bacterium]